MENHAKSLLAIIAGAICIGGVVLAIFLFKPLPQSNYNSLITEGHRNRIYGTEQPKISVEVSYQWGE